MLTILFLLIWRTVATIHGYVKAYAPSNIAIAFLRTRRGIRWAIPVALLAVLAYLLLAWLVTVLVDRGATEWLYLLTFIAYAGACKFAALAVFTPLRWVAVAIAGRADR
ncbi:hypothetical protein [Nocardioides sp. NPDC127503]|uniref:hypothetical protein n=1 Tax=Nocardioides sp. NPDC127503 TaxID=3154516 RepID=UPI0033221188